MLKQLLINPKTTIQALLLHPITSFPNRPALWVQGLHYTYAELYAMAISIANTIPQDTTQCCVILSSRSVTAYAAILATLLANKAYVPLNPKNNLEHNLYLLSLANTNIVIIDKNSFQEAELFLAACKQSLLVIAHGYNELPTWTKKLTQHQYFFVPQSIKKSALDNKHIQQLPRHNNVYMLLTSGSTGTPKAIMVSQTNLLSYLRNIIERYQPDERDRFSQFAELTFDFSVHDIFVCWAVGACLYSLPENYFMGLPKFVSDHQLTFWASVPSTISTLKQLRKLTPGMFNSLRCSIFCGEPLAVQLARVWHEAAPYSIIDNLYGPTEATVAITGYRWEAGSISPDTDSAIIPIGKPFVGQSIAIIDTQRNRVPAGVIGELCLSGSQVINGYWCNPKLSCERFIVMPDCPEKIWYKTGDLVLWDDHHGLLYKGRCDDEIKIRGYRVDRAEIEVILRRMADTELVAVLPLPVTEEGLILGIVAFIAEPQKDIALILQQCRKQLPNYMVPLKIILLDAMPFNSHGKVNYPKLAQLLKTTIA